MNAQQYQDEFLGLCAKIEERDKKIVDLEQQLKAAQAATQHSNGLEALKAIRLSQRAIPMILSRDTGDSKHDWTQCQEVSCTIGRSALIVLRNIFGEEKKNA